MAKTTTKLVGRPKPHTTISWEEVSERENYKRKKGSEQLRPMINIGLGVKLANST